MSAIEAISRQVPSAGLAMILASRSDTPAAQARQAASAVNVHLRTAQAEAPRSAEYWHGYRLIRRDDVADPTSDRSAGPKAAASSFLDGVQATSLRNYASRSD